MTSAEGKPPPDTTRHEAAALATSDSRGRLAGLLGKLLARVWWRRYGHDRMGGWRYDKR